MTIAEKLRFLADRAEDGKEFYVAGGSHEESWDYNSFIKNFHLSEVEYLEFKHKPKWEFTEDEKVILKNVSTSYKWVSRDGRGDLELYLNKPKKKDTYWDSGYEDYIKFSMHNHIFNSIKWSDEEPCEFRRYL